MQWQSMGAPRVHIVDLDGAASGGLVNLDIITEIANAMLIPVQVGGGIRHMETVAELLRAGVERVILGTSAVKNPALVKGVCEKFSESIIVSIDTRSGLVATHGWRKQTELRAVELARSMVDLGVRRFIYTDISRDGTLTEPNFTAISELVSAIRLPVIAAGGISTLDHLSMLARLGVEGAIVGKALYTGNINLKQALDTISQTRISE